MDGDPDVATHTKRRKPVKRARSAGGVVFRRVADPDGLQILVLQHEGGKWMLPKGTIETGETPEAVALREVREETGLSNVRVVEVPTAITRLPRAFAAQVASTVGCVTSHHSR